jgi:hypothetical protein
LSLVPTESDAAGSLLWWACGWKERLKRLFGKVWAWGKGRRVEVGEAGGEVVRELGGLEVSLVCLWRVREGNGEMN